MFTFFKSLFKPPSAQEIKAVTNQRLQNAKLRRRMRTVELKNTEKAPNNGTGRANLRNMPLNAQKMTIRSLDDLLKKNDLSTNARPSFRVNNNKNGKRVTFTVPFSTPNKFTSAMSYLKSMKSETENRGQFKNIEIVSVNPNPNSTLTFTLSSSKNMTVPLPQYFVQKMLGVDVALHKKSKITEEDVINWSKYWNLEKMGKDIKYVQDLIKVDEFFEGKFQRKKYGFWHKYAPHIAKRVEDMRRVIDPKNIPKILGENPKEEDAYELVLMSAMKQYLHLEKRVYKTKKARHDVKSLYKKYRTDNTTLVENGMHLPKFCNIPYDWRVHLVHNTMKMGDTNEPATRMNEIQMNLFGNTNPGGTWNDFTSHLVKHVRSKWDEWDESNNQIMNTAMGEYKKNGHVNNKKINFMEKTMNVMSNEFRDISTPSERYYTFLLRKYRPFIRQSFHTIGSIRYPHSPLTQCPFTKRDDVWEYEFKRSMGRNTKVDGDTWIEILSEREGFVQDLKAAHEEIDNTLDKLVEFYKLKVLREITRKKASTPDKSKRVDIDLAWELYSICEKCELHQHPMFRVCAGFRALNASNPRDSKFMDRFRYMVHNRPDRPDRSEPDHPDNMAHVEFVLTQSDVKYFFLSADIYKSTQHYMMKAIDHNKSRSALNEQNFTKNRNGRVKPQLGCDTLFRNDTVKLLEGSTDERIGNVLLAWPTLHDAFEYYK